LRVVILLPQIGYLIYTSHTVRSRNEQEVVPLFFREITEMAHHLIHVVGIIFTLTLLLAILLRPAQAGEVVTASISSNEQSGESALICLVIIIGTVSLAIWVWAEKMWRFIPS
jgi:hypothetical protein